MTENLFHGPILGYLKRARSLYYILPAKMIFTISHLSLTEIDNGKVKVMTVGSSRTELYTVVDLNDKNMTLKGKYGTLYFFYQEIIVQPCCRLTVFGLFLSTHI